MSKLCFVDIETTGLLVDQHEIWELGYYVEDSDLNLASSDDGKREWTLPVNRLRTAEPKALELSGFYERHPEGRGVPDDTAGALNVASEFERTTRNATLIGANVQFDATFLAKFLKANNRQPSWKFRLCDVEALAQAVLRNPTPVSLAASAKALAERLGVKLPTYEAHKAIDDALLARDVYYMVIHQRLP